MHKSLRMSGTIQRLRSIRVSGPFLCLGHDMIEEALLIDGGHLQAAARKSEHSPARDFFDDFVEQLVSVLLDEQEEKSRVYYYEGRPYSGKAKLPISGESHQFTGNKNKFAGLAARNRFAVRLGSVVFRGWQLKTKPDKLIKKQKVEDSDFSPSFEQKGVDMRIGLDMATISASPKIRKIKLISADTDLIPAMKHARKAGVSVQIVSLPGIRLAHALVEHADWVIRMSEWPDFAEPAPAQA